MRATQPPQHPRCKPFVWHAGKELSMNLRVLRRTQHFWPMARMVDPRAARRQRRISLAPEPRRDWSRLGMDGSFFCSAAISRTRFRDAAWVKTLSHPRKLVSWNRKYLPFSKVFFVWGKQGVTRRCLTAGPKSWLAYSGHLNSPNSSLLYAINPPNIARLSKA
jgi:hypothetical protein